MEKEQIRRDLSFNKLELTNCGLDVFPSKTILIENYFLGSGDDDDREYFLLGFVSKCKSGVADKIAYGFIVKDGLDFYFRDNIEECQTTIQCLRERDKNEKK